MALDPKLLASYLAMMQAKKLRDEQEKKDAQPKTPLPNFNSTLWASLLANKPKQEPPKTNPQQGFGSLASYLAQKLNPYNLGVPDVTNKYKTQGEAYKNAPDKSEFLYNGVRIKKDIASDNRNSALQTNPNFWREYKKNLSEQYPDNEIEKRMNDALDMHYRYGNPKINLLSDDDARSGKFQTTYSDNLKGGRSNFNPTLNSLQIFFNRNGKFDISTLLNNYTEELLHARQLKDLGFTEFQRKQLADYKRNNVKMYDSKDYDAKMYKDDKSIEGVHRLQGSALRARQDRDYLLEESPNLKNDRAEILYRQYKYKPLNPYQNQQDIRVVQKALEEKGYALPKSKLADGTYDGIFGDETKNVLLQYQKSLLK